MAVSKGTIRRYGGRGIGSGGGGGGTRFYEGDLPDADKAPKKTILVRETDNTKWRVGYRTIETVDAVISVEDYVAPSGVVFFGVSSDLSSVSTTELRAGYLVHVIDGWQYKPEGSRVHRSTIAAATITDYPFQGALDTAPTADTAGSYLDTNDDTFYRKGAGAIDSVIDTEAANLFDSGSYTNRGPFATAPTDQSTEGSDGVWRFDDNATSQSYYNTTNGNWYSRTTNSTGNTDWAIVNTAQLNFALQNSVTDNPHVNWIHQDTADTITELITYLEGLDSVPSNIHFYNSTTSTVEEVSSFTAGVPWEATSITELLGDDSIFLGLAGAANSIGVDSSDEAVDYLAEHGEDTTKSYYFINNTGSGILQQVSDVTVKVEWVDSSFQEMITDTDTILLSDYNTAGELVELTETNYEDNAVIFTEADAITYLDEFYDEDKTYHYVDWTDNKLKTVDSFTATVPEHERPILIQLDTEGTITLGPEPNEFDSSTARDTQATDDSDWLAAYDDDPTFLIQIEDSNGDFIYQRRWESAWEDVTHVLRGEKGSSGAALTKATESEAAAGTSTTVKGWTASLIKSAITALSPVANWAKKNNVDVVPETESTSSGDGLTESEVDERIAEIVGHALPQGFIDVDGNADFSIALADADTDRIGFNSTNNVVTALLINLDNGTIDADYLDIVEQESYIIAKLDAENYHIYSIAGEITNSDVFTTDNGKRIPVALVYSKGTISTDDAINLAFTFDPNIDPITNIQYELLWEAGSTDTARTTAYNTAAGSEHNLVTGRAFSDYAEIVFWYDGTSSLRLIMHTVPLELFEDVSTDDPDTSGFVSLQSENGYVNIRRHSDTQFALGGGNRNGLRKIYGIRSND